jgi:hypothetical protein
VSAGIQLPDSEWKKLGSVGRKKFFFEYFFHGFGGFLLGDLQ